MALTLSGDILPDEAARRHALLDHNATLLVEAGAGSGKTSLIAGRIALLLAGGIPAREIAAITFTEAASSELRDRIDRFVSELAAGRVPEQLRLALPDGLSAEQGMTIAAAEETLDELTCTTIHGFCQQLVTPYPVETGIDPGAAIIDPAAADLAYEDLVQAWLSARFGRDRGTEGLGRLPPLPELGEEDFFTELLLDEPDGVVKLILETAVFLRAKRNATAPQAAIDRSVLEGMSSAIGGFADWYTGCGVIESVTKDIIVDLDRLKRIVDGTIGEPITGRRLAQLLRHEVPDCRNDKETRFNVWRNKGKWEKASSDAGLSKARGGQFSADAKAHYERCDDAYRVFVEAVCGAAFARFVAEFDALAKLYADYKRQAALLDFDDLLHHARDLLVGSEAVRQSLSRRYPHILVDEFQDTDPLQAEILWRLCGDGAPNAPWISRILRPGSLFVVGDPKQAVYRFRGADVDTYLAAKRALVSQDPGAVIDITANFRSLKPILDFANDRFQPLLSEEQGQPGFTVLQSTRASPDGRAAVACFDITIDARHKDSRDRLVVDLVRREEAGVVADLLERMIGSYEIWDKQAKAMRPCRAGDFALLAPTGTNLWIYERALERRDIPIASQAGKSFFRRQEVQDLIGITRAIADRRDTLGLGALLRGPLVGLTEEEIADAITALPVVPDRAPPRLHLWTDRETICHPILNHALGVLQNLARKARHTTPYQLIAEAVEELNVRPVLRARYRRGAERALANVELFLEMARAYDSRGLTAFSEALRVNWADAEKQIEGRPDADAEAVSIITMHSAKGLEWPIVIPINSPTMLDDDMKFLHRRSDNTVHFKLLGEAGPHYDQVKNDERDQLRRERIRLWYVALTRACDLLLLPRQSERAPSDWLSLLDPRLSELPAFDGSMLSRGAPAAAEEKENEQDEATWRAEAATIAATHRTIVWRSPSRHEGLAGGQPVLLEEDVYTEAATLGERLPVDLGPALPSGTIQGGRERGLVLHKLLEEVLTREITEDFEALEVRARVLLGELDTAEADRPENGPHAPELAATVLRALSIPEIAALKSRLLPEISVFSIENTGDRITYVGGIVDALALGPDGTIDVVIDWKSDVDPDARQVDLYREQIRDYLAASLAPEGLIVFLTTGQIEKVLLDVIRAVGTADDDGR
jgi:ATP-dependent exoDNAse (exonuclease V) beta subunit